MPILDQRTRRPMARPRMGSIQLRPDRKSTRLNSSHSQISYAVFCLKKKNARRNVGVELMSAHPGCVAVDMRGESCLQLGELVPLPGDDAGKVHHLGHADGSVAPQESSQVTLGECPAR